MNRKTFLSNDVRVCITDWIRFYRTLAGAESCPWVDDIRAEIGRRLACYKILLNAWDAAHEEVKA